VDDRSGAPQVRVAGSARVVFTAALQV